MEWFLHSGSTGARLARTLVEVVLAWIIANIGDILNLFTIGGTVKALIVSGMTVVFTALLGFISDNKKKEAEDGAED
ncbi:MAG: hypothetical protein J6112_03605 [Clostridia bacterium]|nr:hypothetical protein [Clostridia bacterium]